jgi:hypothetical protein
MVFIYFDFQYEIKMFILVPSLQKLNFQNTDSETLSSFEDFITFLRQNLTDGDKNMRMDNIKLKL